MTSKFAFAAIAAAFITAPALAQGEDVYSAEVPDLNQCIADAGADGEATQAELDACISANMGELKAAMPDPSTGMVSQRDMTPRTQDASTATKETEEES